MEAYQEEEVLILVKTYPSPSVKYRETTCVAAVTRDGEMRRIFPVPFRLLEGNAQFQKWEWIKARFHQPVSDHRPESRHIDVDSIKREGKIIKIHKGDWGERLKYIDPLVVPSFQALETRRQESGQTLGAFRPTRLLRLEISPADQSEWSDGDKRKLIQDGLFDSSEIKNRALLRKLPFDFHYRYICDGPDGEREYRHKLVDWEAGALYWRCVNDYGKNWEKKFRERYEEDFLAKDLIFLMGTIHRFPGQWLIIGLIYPPKLKPGYAQQLSLL